MLSISKNPRYPTIEKRSIAWLTDAVIVGIIILLARMAFFAVCMQLQIRLPAGKITIISLTIGVLIAIAYHTFFEGSKLQATPGKMLFGLIVTDLRGNRISLARALSRHMGKYASAFSFGIGYLLYFFSKRKQCLHDMIAKCVIVHRTVT